MVIKRALCALIILITCKANAQAVPPPDSLDQWLSRFSEIRLEEMSPDGKWVSLKKTAAKSDTLMIFSTGQQFLPLQLAGISKVTFLKDDKILSFGSGNAVLRDLKSGILQSYKEIRQYDALKKEGDYVLYDTANRLCFYDSNGKMLSQIANVKRYITDQKELIYAQQDDEDSSAIFKIDGQKKGKVYATSHIIERIELSEFKSYLLLFEKARLSDRRRVVVIGRKDDIIYYPLGPAFIKQDFSTIKEIRNDHSAVFKVVNFQRKEAANVDIYYGNDQDLKSLMAGKKAVEEYWLWNINTNTVQKLDLGHNRSIADIGNGIQFLNFNGDELRDYTHHRPFLNISLYNILTKANYNIGIIKPELAVSESGHYLLYQLKDASWEIFDTSTSKRISILNSELRHPVFTSDDSRIYFESDDGLWQYDMTTKRLSLIKITEGKGIRILNAERSFLSVGYSIYQSSINPDSPMIIEAKDQTADTVSYLSIKNNKIMQHYLTTKNQVSFFSYSDRLDRWCWQEENYNIPSVLKTLGWNAASQILFDESKNDCSAKEIHQEVIAYKLSNGKELKGLLYYPQHFNPSTQYPMIVHIYQIQSKDRKGYLLPKYDGLGFNIRTLLEKGYFVYLPDLVTDSRGPGIAGVECINAALDALKDYPNIDRSKIGLIGHSFGSYLTNFISTQSNRFAAYISGSGVSDIIHSYYSLNRNFPGPHYWQLESGQYQMASSFADNQKLYFKNNPIYYAQRSSAPILLWTGKTDENVVPDNTMNFYIALKRYNKNVIALFYEKSGHSLTNDRERLDLNKKVLDWWDYFLKDRKSIPWIDQQIKKDAH